ncbi:excalibur calcium-binding domain-containing protein [Pasteurella oralis]|uniref:Excalibur calcium-binding domain-containing protein n=1 Tax=Pasteurella oralis TaxID=1071947 RepID=A0ABW4NSP8_9PAST|nr:excalibur calcium-binding domain-containing protein [Pasteurella oralis]MDO5053734.1 excalibur calcium-binding domain-containing protein [Pasteurella oralis]
MKRILFGLLILIISYNAVAKRVSCKSFKTQAQAQAYMERYAAYHLDGDGDGEACECLPGGSSYGSSKCRK